MQGSDAPVDEVVIPDIGGWISGPSYEVPEPACYRCQDWTTVYRGDGAFSPCPVCRPDEYNAWRGERPTP